MKRENIAGRQNGGKRQTARKKAASPKKLMSIIVLFISVGVLFGITVLIGAASNKNTASSLPAQSQSASSAAAEPQSTFLPSENSAPTQQPGTASVLPEIEKGPFYEEEMPPLYNAAPGNILPENYVPALQDVGNGQKMEPRAAAAFSAMQQAAAQDGVTLTPLSGYRTHERQKTNFENSIARYEAQGYSNEEAVRLTRRYYAVPGTSEHEAGLAIDINQIEDSFENTSAFEWLQAHCTEYGFIFRYQKTTEEITGIAYEPWHYRYVGSNHAKAITEQGVTLEEYLGAPAVGAP